MDLTPHYFNQSQLNKIISDQPHLANKDTGEATLVNASSQCTLCLQGVFGPHSVTVLHAGISKLPPAQTPGIHLFHKNCLQDCRTANPAFNSHCPYCRSSASIDQDIYFSPVAHAVQAGQKEQALELITNGVDPDVRHSWDGMAAIHIATKKGNLPLIRSLLGCGADINLQDKNGMTALHHAVQNKDIKTLKMLLDLKADINLQSVVRKTALYLAAMAPENPELFDTLIDNGAFFDQKDTAGLNVMHVAAISGHVRALKKLIAKHADVNVVDLMRCTPLFRAIYTFGFHEKPLGKNTPEVVRVLIGAGARIFYRNHMGYTVFDTFWERCSPPYLELLKELLPAAMASYADVSMPVCYSGETLLFFALLAKDKPAVQTLISRGARADAGSIGIDDRRFTHLLNRLGEQKQAFVEILNQARSSTQIEDRI